MYNVGDFITTNYSFFPSLIVKNINIDETHHQENNSLNTNSYLITIHEYGGDYKIISENMIIGKVLLENEEKLSLIFNYGEWFYEEHINISQELLIQCIIDNLGKIQ